MSNNDDRIFYGAYGGVFISLGIWVVLWALEIITGMTAALLWILTIGIIIMITSNISPVKKPKGKADSRFGLLFGFILIILSISSLAAVNEFIDSIVAIGLIIILIGLGILIFGISSKK